MKAEMKKELNNNEYVQFIIMDNLTAMPCHFLVIYNALNTLYNALKVCRILFSL
jgi:hypothetical protein